MSNKYVPAHMHDKNPNPKLLKFVRRVTDRLPGKLKGIKTEDPEYWGFACIFEDEMTEEEREKSLDLLLQMKTRKKYPYAEVKKMFGENDPSFEAIIDKLAMFGMVEYDYGDKYTKMDQFQVQLITKKIDIIGFLYLFQVLLNTQI